MTGFHIVAIVGIVFGTLYAIFSKVYSADNGKKHQSEIDRLNDEVADLKERFAVLEKIVTDEKFDLKQKIDSL